MTQTQTIGQSEAAASRRPNPRNANPTFNRGPEEGNVLWKLYKELGFSDRTAFWALCEALPLAKQTFYKYSKADHKLGDISTSVFVALRGFFLKRAAHDIFGEFMDEQPDAPDYSALPLFAPQS